MNNQDIDNAESVIEKLSDDNIRVLERITVRSNSAFTVETISYPVDDGGPYVIETVQRREKGDK